MYHRIFPWLNVRRTAHRDLILGSILAFIAGATNAGGFLAVDQYTSHMTGMVSSLADHLVREHYLLLIQALLAIISFIMGTMTASILVHLGQRLRIHSRYTLPLLLEAFLLLLFGLMGGQLNHFITLLLPATVIVLCFLMGLQNATITIISRSRIRTTHVTGIVTDIGIELGKLFYINRHLLRTPKKHKVTADRQKLLMNTILLSMFIFGALVGAFGFKIQGYAMTIPLAGVLLLLSLPPLITDLIINLRKRYRRVKRYRLLRQQRSRNPKNEPADQT